MPDPIRAAIIPPHGPIEVREITQDLATLRSYVEGYIEAVHTLYDDDGTAQVTIWCNEEGKLHGLPINHRATVLWYTLNDGPTGDTLSGTIVLTGGADDEGDLLPLPEAIAELCATIDSHDTPF